MYTRIYALSGYLTARADTLARRAREERGQVTVEYIGLIVVIGTLFGLVANGLGGIGVAIKIGRKVVDGIAGGIDKIIKP